MGPVSTVDMTLKDVFFSTDEFHDEMFTVSEKMSKKAAEYHKRCLEVNNARNDISSQWWS